MYVNVYISSLIILCPFCYTQEKRSALSRSGGKVFTTLKGVVAAFWWDVPAETRPRQQLELALIQKWRSPFNKENWDRWGQPFGK
jgi:hypothetical protein